MKKKSIITAALALSLTLAPAFCSFAGEWKRDDIGWWWQEDDGSYPVDTWKWLDGNDDGVYEQYHFNADGYLDENAAVSGLRIDEGGARLDEAGRVMTAQNGSGADKQTKFFFYDDAFKETRVVKDNSEYMSEYPDLKPGIAFVYENISLFDVTRLDLSYTTGFASQNYYYVRVADTDNYTEDNYYADEDGRLPVGKVVRCKDGDGSSYVRVFGYY